MAILTWEMTSLRSRPIWIHHSWVQMTSVGSPAKRWSPVVCVIQSPANRFLRLRGGGCRQPSATSFLISHLT